MTDKLWLKYDFTSKTIVSVNTKIIFVGIGLIAFEILSSHGWLGWFPKFSH